MTFHVFIETVTNGFDPLYVSLIVLISILFAISVIITKNPVVSILFLIGLFFTVAIYLILLGLHFIGLSYLLVYVGAVSILFIFILMLIDVRVSELLTENKNSIALAVIAVLCFNFTVNFILPANVDNFDAFFSYFSSIILYLANKMFSGSTLGLNNLIVKHTANIEIATVTSKSWDSFLVDHNHITSIGNVLYTDLSPLLIITSLVLLLAMVGTIVITVRKQSSVSNQSSFAGSQGLLCSTLGIFSLTNYYTLETFFVNQSVYNFFLSWKQNFRKKIVLFITFRAFFFCLSVLVFILTPSYLNANIIITGLFYAISFVLIASRHFILEANLCKYKLVNNRLYLDEKYLILSYKNKINTIVYAVLTVMLIIIFYTLSNLIFFSLFVPLVGLLPWDGFLFLVSGNQGPPSGPQEPQGPQGPNNNPNPNDGNHNTLLTDHNDADEDARSEAGSEGSNFSTNWFEDRHFRPGVGFDHSVLHEVTCNMDEQQMEQYQESRVRSIEQQGVSKEIAYNRINSVVDSFIDATDCMLGDYACFKCDDTMTQTIYPTNSQDNQYNIIPRGETEQVETEQVQTEQVETEQVQTEQVETEQVQTDITERNTFNANKRGYESESEGGDSGPAKKNIKK